MTKTTRCKAYKISAIIPAYNEEKYIGNVLKILTSSKYLDEIICVNDGSTDNTLNMVRKVKNVTILNFKKNHGKGHAIAKGIEKAIGDIVIFIDADIVGLDDGCIRKLITPLVNNQYHAVIGYPNSTNLDELFRPLGGQRAYFRKDLLPLLKIIEKKGYGLELYLNYIFRDKKVKLIPLRKVSNSLKHHKQSYDFAVKLTLIESMDILSEIFKQENPGYYLIKSYLYPFYINKPEKIDLQIKKLISRIKKKLIDDFREL